METLWYAVHEQVTKGKIIVMPATLYGPEFLIFHSEMEAKLVAASTGMLLRHIRESLPPEKTEQPRQVTKGT